MPENKAVKVPFYKQKKFQAALLGAAFYLVQSLFGVNLDSIQSLLGIDVPAPCAQESEVK